MPLPRVRRHHRLPLVATIAVGVGLLPMPGEFYVLLQWFLCGSCVYYLSSGAQLPEWQKLILVALVVLHNPIMPVPLGDKSVWSVLSLATVVYFWILAARGPLLPGRW